MYPSTELDILAVRKMLVCSRIHMRRGQCVTAAARIAQPLSWVDRAWAQWRTISPLVKLAAVPLGFTLKKRFLPKGGKGGLIGNLMRWAPLAIGAWRFYNGMRERRSSARFE